MHKINKIIKIWGILIIGFATNIGLAHALNSQLSLSKSPVAPGESFSVSIVASDLPATGLNVADYVLTYDSGKVEYVGISSVDTNIVSNNNGSSINISYMPPSNLATSSGAIIVVNFKALSSASDGNVSFSLSGSNYADGNATPVSGTTGGTTLSIHKPSTACNLTSLAVSGMTLTPAFASSKTSYTLPETTASSIVISATADAGAKITGMGTQTLNYGSNKFDVVVTAEDGISKKTYSINVVKTDNRSKNNYLSSIYLSYGEINFDKNTLDYTVNLAADIEQINIAITLEDNKSRVKGAGKKTLNLGANEFAVVVTAENGEQRTYTITVYRGELATDPKPAVTESNEVLLKTLTINDNGIDLIANQFVYLFGVSNEIIFLKIDATAVDETTQITIEGKDDLETGITPVYIILTNGTKQTTYTVLVNKDSIANRIESLAEATGTKLTEPAVLNLAENADKTIYASVLSLIKEQQSSLTVNVVNRYNGLLYQVLLDKNINSQTDINISLEKYDAKYLAYKTKLPTNVKIRLFLGNDFVKAQNILIYNYLEKNNQYQLMNKSYAVKNGYVEFTTNGSSYYVFSTTKITNVKPKTKSSSNFLKYFLTATGSLLVGVGGTLSTQILLKKLKKRKKNKKEEIEVL